MSPEESEKIDRDFRRNVYERLNKIDSDIANLTHTSQRNCDKLTGCCERLEAASTRHEQDLNGYRDRPGLKDKVRHIDRTVRTWRNHMRAIWGFVSAGIVAFITSLFKGHQ